jgi:hypothetical protein
MAAADEEDEVVWTEEAGMASADEEEEVMEGEGITGAGAE